MGATAALGTQLKVKNPSTGIYAAITGLGDMEGPDENTETIDVTSHSSPGNREEFLLGIIRSGSVRAPLKWDSADPTHRLLRTLYKNRTQNIDFKIIMTDTDLTEIDFKGLVQSFGRRYPVNGPNEANFAIKVTGDVTETY